MGKQKVASNTQTLKESEGDEQERDRKREISKPQMWNTGSRLFSH